MKKIRINVIKNNLFPAIFVDGKLLKLNRHGSKIPYSEIEINQENIQLEIKTPGSELAEKNWGKWWTLWFFLSIFSVFNPSYSKKDLYSINYSGSLNVSQISSFTLDFNKPEKGKKAVIANSETGIVPFDDNDSNVFVYDEKAAKRRKGLGFLRALMVILFTIGLIFLIILLIDKHS